MLEQMKSLAVDQNFIKSWLERINETDKAIIHETMDSMRTKPEYRKFIVDYAKGQA